MPEAGPSDNPATKVSIALLGELVRLGVRHVVVSPGSRSQALALVAAEFERIGAIELHVRIDERVGGFLALGLALESGAPAVVVTTSGTAVANLHPAVLEAYEARVPMIVVTADRPSELRGIRSNQTTTQAGVFGAATRYSAELHAEHETDGAAAAAELWAASSDGPAHLNLAFRDPLSAEVPELSGLLARLASGPRIETSRGGSADPAAARPPREVLDRGRRTIVIAGDKSGPEAEALARAGGWPLIAEVSSGARFGPNLIVAYRALLRDQAFGGRVERAVVFGHPTLSREIPALLERPEVETIVVDASGAPDFYDPGHDARRAGAAELAASPDLAPAESREWLGRWVMTSRALLEEEARAAAGADQSVPDLDAGHSPDHATRAAFVRGELAAVRAQVTRRMLADALWRFTWPHDRLVVAASRLIRELDGTVPGKKITVHANRGLAGIDGTVATGIGVALAASSRLAPLGERDAAGASAGSDGAAGSDGTAGSNGTAESRDAVESYRVAESHDTASRITGTTRVLIGDLALLYDVGALLRAPGERMPPLQLVVGNDHGGTIFEGLEVAESADPAAFERVQLTPRDVDLAALARAYGWRYVRAATRGELDQALSAVTPEPTLIEVPL